MDLFALKRGQLVAFCVGDRAGMLEIALAMRDTSGDRPYFNGMLCFALEQNGRYDEALAAGKRVRHNRACCVRVVCATCATCAVCDVRVRFVSCVVRW
jgi:hypothetical protein